jgi:hypothetical protein
MVDMVMLKSISRQVAIIVLTCDAGPLHKSCHELVFLGSPLGLGRPPAAADLVGQPFFAVGVERDKAPNSGKDCHDFQSGSRL